MGCLDDEGDPKRLEELEAMLADAVSRTWMRRIWYLRRMMKICTQRGAGDYDAEILKKVTSGVALGRSPFRIVGRIDGLHISLQGVMEKKGYGWDIAHGQQPRSR